MGNSSSVNFYGLVNDNGDERFQRRLARVSCDSDEAGKNATRIGLISRHDFCWDEYTDWDKVPKESYKKSSSSPSLGPGISDFDIYTMPYDLANWMQNLRDNVYLRDLALPGSHDAGTAQVDKATSNWSRTQAYSIITQLILGMRVFDIRPTRAGKSGGRDDGDIWTHHGGIKGEKLARAVNCVRLFLEAYPTETAIFILSHYEKVSKEDVYAEIREHIGEDRYIGDDNGRYDVNLLMVATARGKLVVIDENKTDRHLGPNGHGGTNEWSQMLQHLRSIESTRGMFNRYVAALTPQPNITAVWQTPENLAKDRGLPGLKDWLNETDSNKIGIVEADWFGSAQDIKGFASAISEKNRSRGHFRN